MSFNAAASEGLDVTDGDLRQWDYLTRTFDVAKRFGEQPLEPLSPVPSVRPVSHFAAHTHASLPNLGASIASSQQLPKQAPPHLVTINAILDVSNPRAIRLPRQSISFTPRGCYLPVETNVGPCILQTTECTSNQSLYTTDSAMLDRFLASQSYATDPWNVQSHMTAHRPHTALEAMIGLIQPNAVPTQQTAEHVDRKPSAVAAFENPFDIPPQPPHFQHSLYHAPHEEDTRTMTSDTPAPSNRLAQAIEKTAASRMAVEVAAVAAGASPVRSATSASALRSEHSPALLHAMGDTLPLDHSHDMGTLHAAAAAAAPVAAMPLRSDPKQLVCKPLTPYNYFFRDERDNILQGLQHSGDELPPPVSDFSISKREYLLFQRWHVDPTKEKRSHRKSHGKIEFARLSRVIAQRWKRLPESGRKFYQELSQLDRHHYDES